MLTAFFRAARRRWTRGRAHPTWWARTAPAQRAHRRSADQGRAPRRSAEARWAWERGQRRWARSNLSAVRRQASAARRAARYSDISRGAGSIARAVRGGAWMNFWPARPRAASQARTGRWAACLASSAARAAAFRGAGRHDAACAGRASRQDAEQVLQRLLGCAAPAAPAGSSLLSAHRRERWCWRRFGTARGWTGARSATLIATPRLPTRRGCAATLPGPTGGL